MTLSPSTVVHVHKTFLGSEETSINGLRRFVYIHWRLVIDTSSFENKVFVVCFLLKSYSFKKNKCCYTTFILANRKSESNDYVCTVFTLIMQTTFTKYKWRMPSYYKCVISNSLYWWYSNSKYKIYIY